MQRSDHVRVVKLFASQLFELLESRVSDHKLVGVERMIGLRIHRREHCVALLWCTLNLVKVHHAVISINVRKLERVDLLSRNSIYKNNMGAFFSLIVTL